MKTVQKLMDFLNKAHSPYHAAQAVEQMLRTAGYTQLREKDAWGLLTGGKYYVIRGGSSIIAFRIPQKTPTGFMMSASHDDFPSFQVKENLELAGRYTRMDTEKYGGMIISTWLDRPLSVAGRVMVETEDGVQMRLIDIDKDLTLIPNVAIHMRREVNEGQSWNPAVDTIPLLGGPEAAGKLRQEIEKAAGGKVLSHDLRLYLRQKAAIWGVEEEYLSAAGLDDLTSVFCSAQGFLDADCSDAIPVLCVFDNEEIGSGTFQGADSSFLEGVLTRICRSRGLRLEQMLAQSFMISADNGHAVHPNHPEYADPGNAPVVNGGVALKFQAGRNYTTDGLSASLFRKVCDAAGVKLQTFYNRGDMKGGSTLGNVSLTHVSVPSVDVGLAQLAMHSAFETAGVADIRAYYRVFQTFFSLTLECPQEGSYTLR